MSRAYQSICTSCKHAEPDSRTCLAFPNGIPDVITRGSNPHREPLENQSNDIVYDLVIRRGHIFYDSDQCFDCRNYISDLKCTAFPAGIALKIITGEVSHDKPYPGQDFEIVFEQR